METAARVKGTVMVPTVDSRMLGWLEWCHAKVDCCRLAS